MHIDLMLQREWRHGAAREVWMLKYWRRLGVVDCEFGCGWRMGARV